MQPIKPIHSNQSIPGSRHEVTCEESMTKLKPTIESLTEYESIQLKEAFDKTSHLMQEYECNNNILTILRNTPTELADKLKVVISTHEKSELIEYFGKQFIHHVFLLCETQNTLTIFDPQLNTEKMVSSEWIKTVFKKDTIEDILKNSYLTRYLPQFRVMDAVTFMENYDESLEFSTLSPEFRSAQSQSGMTQSKLWKNSVRINLYDAVMLFDNSVSYESMIECYNGYDSPLKRIGISEIEYLQKFYKNT